MINKYYNKKINNNTNYHYHYCSNNKIDDDYKTFTRRFDALKRHLFMFHCSEAMQDEVRLPCL